MTKKIPEHVAIIMDGNGRWAKSRGLPRLVGHREGVKAAERILEAARDLGIKIITLYTFSTENWKRPKKEIEALFKILENYLARNKEKLNKNNIRFSVIGRTEELPLFLRNKLEEVMNYTGKNTGFVLNLALNYGSRAEIVNAVRKISDDVKAGKLESADIDEKIFSSYLYTKNLPDPDLLIRTSGEYRISNFLLWQISYSELYITKKLWPDFGRKDLQGAIREYRKRERRFGS